MTREGYGLVSIFYLWDISVIEGDFIDKIIQICPGNYNASIAISKLATDLENGHIVRKLIAYFLKM